MGRVANAVKSKTKRMNERISRAKEVLPLFSNLKFGIEGLFAKCTMHMHFKRTTLTHFLYLEKQQAISF